MRVLIYPHELGTGGSQTDAIELAAQVRALGVEPIIFGRPGLLVERIRDLGLEFVESPQSGGRPSTRIARRLRTLAVERAIDVLHGYEWPPALECTAAAYALPATVAVATVISAAVPPFIPHTTPLVVGTRQIAARERSAGRTRTYVLEPPVDLLHNVPPAESEVLALRRRWGLRTDSTLLVCVTRFTAELETEALLSAIHAMSRPLADLDLQLLVVGDGPAREQIRCAAAHVNSMAGPGRVVLTGELADPRAAYASADIVLGMGGSALRALAFAKPLIVQGENGFCELLTDKTFPIFGWQGWHGVGHAATSGGEHLAAVVRELAGAPVRRAVLGAYGRHLVADRFSLEVAATTQVRIYEKALAERPTHVRTALAMVRAGVRFTTYGAVRKTRQLGRDRSAEDFHARPVAPAGLTSQPAPAHPHEPALVYLAGDSWQAVAGTDVHLATALSRRVPVIWVDPPTSVLARLRQPVATPVISEVAPGITRVSATGPPGITRPGIRQVARWWAHRTTQRYLRASGRTIAGVLASTTEPVLEKWAASPVQRLYFATDDFVAGAELMGLPRQHLARSRERNLEAADTVLAVTPTLADELRRPHLDVHVFPNGCDPKAYASGCTPATGIPLSHPIAGVVGQFNPRLNLACLEAVADAGVSLLLVGPRFDRTREFGRRLDELFARPNVHWIDRRPHAELPSYFAALTVGLTPYADSAFNRASFPLKTLEYLAAGLHVVSTDLPAARELDQRFVSVTGTPAAFAAATAAALTAPPSGELTRQRRQYATTHSWQDRAERLLTIAFGTANSGTEREGEPNRNQSGHCQLSR